jgi:SH3-like domain-containing protein
VPPKKKPAAHVPAKTPLAKKHVPVVTAHHGPPKRHAAHAPLRPTSAKPTLPKAPPVKPPANPVAAAPAKPEPPPAPLPPDVGTVTKLHLPRFAALKTDEVNMRSGPGERYPVLWQYQRRDLPVKIEREFDVWRLVEDMDGIKGWVHEATLTGHRDFLVTGTADVSLRAKADDTSEAVAILKPGVIGRLRACDATGPWCQVQVQSYQGFVKRTEIWGLLEGEAITP